MLRARAVDLAGNSLLPRDEDFGPEDPERNARAFLRYEPVAAPVVALVRAGGVTERPAEGESMYRMAIRTYNATPADNTVPTTERRRRFAVPQQVSVREAEHHGMLDRNGAVDSKTFDLLANQKDRSAEDPAAALVQESIPTSGPLEQGPPEKTTFAVYKDGEVLTYLPDPLAEEVAIRISGIPGVDPAEVMTIPLYPSGGWPEAQPFKIELVEGPGDLPAFEGGTRTLRVPLEKGVPGSAADLGEALEAGAPRADGRLALGGKPDGGARAAGAGGTALDADALAHARARCTPCNGPCATPSSASWS